MPLGGKLSQETQKMALTFQYMWVIWSLDYPSKQYFAYFNQYLKKHTAY